MRVGGPAQVTKPQSSKLTQYSLPHLEFQYVDGAVPTSVPEIEVESSSDTGSDNDSSTDGEESGPELEEEPDESLEMAEALPQVRIYRRMVHLTLTGPHQASTSRPSKRKRTPSPPPSRNPQRKLDSFFTVHSKPEEEDFSHDDQGFDFSMDPLPSDNEAGPPSSRASLSSSRPGSPMALDSQHGTARLEEEEEGGLDEVEPEAVVLTDMEPLEPPRSPATVARINAYPLTREDKTAIRKYKREHPGFHASDDPWSNDFPLLPTREDQLLVYNEHRNIVNPWMEEVGYPFQTLDELGKLQVIWDASRHQYYRPLRNPRPEHERFVNPYGNLGIETGRKAKGGKAGPSAPRRNY